MRIAITGASGFIGTELLNELSKTNVEVLALTRGTVSEETGNNIIWKTTDYSIESLKQIFQNVDTIVHLAGVRGTTTNREDYVINETMTTTILQAMDACNVSRIIFASTISVYNNEALIPWRETDPLEARTMYGESKIACEELIQDYCHNSDCRYFILRIAQVLGLGEKRRGMMNVFLDTADAGREITVIGESKAKRQYIFVNDLVKIISEIIMRDDESQILNVGMSEAYTNLEIARIINEVFENKTPINYDDSKPESIKSSHMSIDNLRNVLKYCPLNMMEAVEKIREIKKSGDK